MQIKSLLLLAFVYYMLSIYCIAAAAAATGAPSKLSEKIQKSAIQERILWFISVRSSKKNNFDFFLLVHTIFIALFLFHFRLTLQCLKLVCHSVRLGFFFPSYSIILQRLSMVRATLFLNNLVHTYLCRQLNRIVYVFRNIIIA